MLSTETLVLLTTIISWILNKMVYQLICPKCMTIRNNSCILGDVVAILHSYLCSVAVFFKKFLIINVYSAIYCRFSSAMDRHLLPSDSDPVPSPRYPASPGSRPPHSPATTYQRRSSYCDPGDASTGELRLRDSSTGPSSYSGSLRRSASTQHDQHHLQPLSRNGSLQDPFTSSLSSRSETPVGYHRYSSVLEDVPSSSDWGFRSLRRRNSKNLGSSKHFSTDDTQF